MPTMPYRGKAARRRLRTQVFESGGRSALPALDRDSWTNAASPRPRQSGVPSVEDEAGQADQNVRSYLGAGWNCWVQTLKRSHLLLHVANALT